MVVEWYLAEHVFELDLERLLLACDGMRERLALHHTHGCKRCERRHEA